MFNENRLSGKRNIAAYIIFTLMLLLFAERIIVFFQLGADSVLGSDDVAYIESGLRFAESGMVSIHDPYPSAMIMPGMPVLIGLMSFLFGSGQGLLTSLKMLWIAMGCATAFMAYKTVRIFLPGAWGIFAAACYLLPNIAWADNIILTETPYSLFFICCVYSALKMGQSDMRKHFIFFTLSFMAALMFRANILSIAPVTLIYLLIKKWKEPKKLILKRCAAFVCAALCFFLPWAIRNYLRFDAFIPVSYGSGNPMLLGTYQGEGWPEESELDYDENVNKPFLEKYGRYFDESGENVENPCHRQYISLERDRMSAQYRMKYWLEHNPASFLKTYLYTKPRMMLNWPWYWNEVLNTPISAIQFVYKVNCILCIAAVLLSLIMKKFRAPVLFLSAVYSVNLYIYATAFASDRYTAVIMPLRFMLACFALCLIYELFKKLRGKLNIRQ